MVIAFVLFTIKGRLDPDISRDDLLPSGNAPHRDCR
jgi:hypothetical protein